MASSAIGTLYAQFARGKETASAGVESTARHAYTLGYNITLAVDAMTDRNVEAHQNSRARILPRLGETGTPTEFVALLDRTHGTA